MMNNYKEYFARVTFTYAKGDSVSDTYTIYANNLEEAKHEAIETMYLLEGRDYDGIINLDWIYEK